MAAPKSWSSRYFPEVLTRRLHSEALTRRLHSGNLTRRLLVPLIRRWQHRLWVGQPLC